MPFVSSVSAKPRAHAAREGVRGEGGGGGCARNAIYLVLRGGGGGRGGRGCPTFHVEHCGGGEGHGGQGACAKRAGARQPIVRPPAARGPEPRANTLQTIRHPQPDGG